MHLLKEWHISSTKYEAGFPFSQIYTKKLIIFLPFFPLKNSSFAKESTCEALIPRKVVNSLISRKATLSPKHQVISNVQHTLEFGTNEKITVL